jgi:hypothetical protein
MPTLTAPFADLELALGDRYTLTTTARGWAEVRINPDHALHGVNKAGRAVDARGIECDFIRVTHEDESYFALHHLTHNGVIKGQASLSGSMAGFLGPMVREFCEVAF